MKSVQLVTVRTATPAYKMPPMTNASDTAGHPETLTALLDRAVATGPDAPAVIFEGATVTYGALADEAARVAGFLHARGIAAGDRVAFWLPNTPAYLAAYFACARRGAGAVAVNTRYRAAEVGDVLARSRARALILWPGFRGIDFRGILAEVDAAALQTVETVIVYDETGESAGFDLPGCETMPYAAAADHAPYAEDHATPDSPCNLFTTSGTTSAPKLVLQNQRSIAVHASEVVGAFGYGDPATVTLLALPLCGVFGFCQAMAVLASGRPTVLMSAFDAAEARICASSATPRSTGRWRTCRNAPTRAASG
jgi:fatty-acyl-CoA synthase